MVTPTHYWAILPIWCLNNNGIYAQMVKNPNCKTETFMVQAGEYAAKQWSCKRKFDASGDVVTCAGHNTLLSNDEFYHHADRKRD